MPVRLSHLLVDPHSLCRLLAVMSTNDEVTQLKRLLLGKMKDADLWGFSLIMGNGAPSIQTISISLQIENQITMVFIITNFPIRYMV